ncbi:MAG: 50S ribosomal protein L13 [Candidatus Omnitrophica bacterium]|nr:50S ribosomal protein L13 [Candidatus Omnitrophota bacterium]
MEPAKWFLVDAKNEVLGRLATRIARILMGKNKRTYVPYWESGDYVIVINASEIRVTGKKSSQKMYDHYSGYPGGRREYSFEKLIAKDPREVVRRAVVGMIPKNRLGDRMMTHLLIYPGAEHRHNAQNPTPVVEGKK